MVQVSCQNIKNFSRNSYFQVDGRTPRPGPRTSLVCALIWSIILKKFTDAVH